MVFSMRLYVFFYLILFISAFVLPENPSYEDFKQQCIKQFNLKEPSPELYEIAFDALKTCGITRPVIFLEDTKQHTDYEGFVFESKPYSLFVLTSLRNSSIEERNSKIFIAYHECGHLHYRHHAHRLLVDKLFAAPTTTALKENFMAAQTLYEKINEGFDLTAHYRDQEKQADLFACDGLIKKGREDIILQSIIAPHAAEGDISHPSMDESRTYLKECLLKKGSISPFLYEAGLRYAITFNATEFMNRMLDETAPVNTTNSAGYTALHRAAQNGDMKLAQRLISAKASLNAADEKGLVPLLWALEFNHENVFRLLLSHGAAVNIKDKNGFAPLHHAVQRGNKVHIQLLLQAGALKAIKDPSGLTPHDWAQNLNKTDVAALLR
jgi:hypothetical protein